MKNNFSKRNATRLWKAQEVTYAHYKVEAYSRITTAYYDCFQLTTLIFKLFLMFMYVLVLRLARSFCPSSENSSFLAAPRIPATDCLICIQLVFYFILWLTVSLKVTSIELLVSERWSFSFGFFSEYKGQWNMQIYYGNMEITQKGWMWFFSYDGKIISILFSLLN